METRLVTSMGIEEGKPKSDSMAYTEKMLDM